MNINLENMLRHHGIPQAQRQALADDVFSIFLAEYTKHDLNPFNVDFVESVLVNYGFMRGDLGE